MGRGCKGGREASSSWGEAAREGGKLHHHGEGLQGREGGIIIIGRGCKRLPRHDCTVTSIPALCPPRTAPLLLTGSEFSRARFLSMICSTWLSWLRVVSPYPNEAYLREKKEGEGRLGGGGMGKGRVSARAWLSWPSAAGQPASECGTS